MPFWCYMHMRLFGKKGTTWPPEGPQSNMVIRFFDSWRQSICPLKFQSPTVKDTKKGTQKWHEGTKQLIRQLREQPYRTCCSAWGHKESDMTEWLNNIVAAFFISNSNCSLLVYKNVILLGVSLVAQMVKNPPAIQETWVRSQGQEDPLEEGMQPTPVSCLENPHGQKSLPGYSPWGCKESDTTEWLSTHTILFHMLCLHYVLIMVKYIT